MRCESFKQFIIVKEDTAQAFNARLNAELKRLRDKYPKPEFTDADPFLCRISYTETVRIPETLFDEYQLAGVQLTCSDCPLFEPRLKADGTEDARCKIGACAVSRHGKTFRHSKMCDEALGMLNSGRMKLCLSESE